MKYIIVSVLIIAAAVIGGYVVLYDRLGNESAEEAGGDTQERQVYRSTTYGFSFETPGHLKQQEYGEGVIAVGSSTPSGGFDAAVEVHVAMSDEEGGYESYDEFLFEWNRNMCAADGPNETIYCDAVLQRQPFTAASGLSGEVFYLNRVHENFESGETDLDAFGPIFAFNIQANVPESTYSALIVRPPASLRAAEINSALVREIASSVQIEREERAAGDAELGLVTAVGTTASSTMVVVDFVEWLEGDAAVAAAALDTECTADNAEECVPSLANNFYIRNLDTATTTYPVAPDARLVLLEGTTPVTSTIGDVEAWIADLQSPLLAAIEIENGTVIRIEQVYMP